MKTLFDVTYGTRSLGWADRMNPKVVFMLPKNLGENYAAYVRRFFNEIRGLGNVCVYRGKRRIATRDW